MSSTKEQLITALKNHPDGFISSERLSDTLNISLDTVRKHLDVLEKDGYIIKVNEEANYLLGAKSIETSQTAIAKGLNTEWLGKTIIHKEITDSTQRDVRDAAKEGKSHGTVVIANAQTNSKGRMGRVWHSSKGKGIWMSILLKPKITPQKATLLTLVTATVLADVFSDIKSLRIKWPNDILIGDKKIAGILTEMQMEKGQIQYIALGIGINVNQTTEDMPEDIREMATSLQIETNHFWNMNTLIQDILQVLEQRYIDFMENGFTSIKQKWEENGYRIGESIRINVPDEQYEAIFLGIDDDGALLVLHDGTEKKLYSAEIDWFNNKGRKKEDDQNKA
ncbi:MAG TPA: biotin--[acetyl-CoA-carboxylase] ligase [Bacillota bacterium]|nr:biotin--[acetyl-CoA-carboxylase] ligase [Bacillota bacterium]